MAKVKYILNLLLWVSPFLVATIIGAFLFVGLQVRDGYSFAGETRIFTEQGRLVPGSDYRALYSAAKHFVNGENIYFNNTPYSFYEEEIQQPGNITGYVYPPLLKLLTLPLLLLPFNAAYFVYVGISLLLLIAGIWVLAQHVSQKAYFVAVTVFAYLFSPILLLHFERGQSDIVIFFLIALSFNFFVKKKSIPAGILMGLAMVLKLTPFIFLPYFFFRDRKSFYWSLLSVLVGSAISGLQANLDFLKVIKKFAGGFSSGVYSNGLLGVVYNKYSFDLMSFSQAKIIFLAVVAVIVCVIFYYIYRNTKKGLSSSVVLLSEFGALASCMVIIPSASWLYNGVHLVFLFAAYWALRPILIAKAKNILVLFQDTLFFLVFSLPVLFSLSATWTKFFSLRGLYVMVLGVMILYLSQKYLTKENQSV